MIAALLPVFIVGCVVLSVICGGCTVICAFAAGRADVYSEEQANRGIRIACAFGASGLLLAGAAGWLARLAHG